jgi:hypothetical protein
MRTSNDAYYEGWKEGFLVGMGGGLLLSAVFAVFVWSVFYA